MENQPEIYEYELIDICFQPEYELQEEDAVGLVCEDEPINDADTTQIEYDADGIPMGNTQEDKLIRREKIHTFIQQWRAEHRDNPRIFNNNLQEFIKVNQVFMLESVLHSAIRYQSTKAIMRMEEVMANAIKIGEMKVKESNSNQKPFQQMLVMRYSDEELGDVKVTVGVRKRTLEKVQYGITVPSPDVPFIDNSMRAKKKTKPKNRKKRPK